MTVQSETDPSKVAPIVTEAQLRDLIKRLTLVRDNVANTREHSIAGFLAGWEHQVIDDAITRITRLAALTTTPPTQASGEVERLRETAMHYMSQFGQALEANGIPLGEDQRQADANLRAALATPPARADAAAGGHSNTEAEAIELFEHLNCPACGGSGHIDDVARANSAAGDKSWFAAVPAAPVPQSGTDNQKK